MPKDPYAVLHALLRAESLRERRGSRSAERPADPAPAERGAARPEDEQRRRRG
ncbi:hypothetical protein ACIBI4_31890 [Streptomyces sp. NPDC050418]|uniref:hypothetical protein n=1 Tax=Streptomyces sp. NPDC050418 TaxID=3365612 RepID=UPI0037B01F5B